MVSSEAHAALPVLGNLEEVQPNEFGRMPGPMAARELAAACIYKQERDRASFQSELLPEEAENSDRPSPDQHLMNSEPPADANVLISHKTGVIHQGKRQWSRVAGPGCVGEGRAVRGWWR